MPKPIARSKTKKAVAKRFKITGTGKILRAHASRRHLLASKSAKRKRHLAKQGLVHDTAFIRIVEYHCPIHDLLKAFPIVARLEAELFTRVLGAAVQREEAHASGLYRCVFTLHGRPA